MKRATLLGGAGVLVLVMPAAGAHGQWYHMNIDALETGCRGIREMCFEVMSGNLADVDRGDVLEITLWNRGSIPHELWITTADRADPRNQATSNGRALAGTGDPVDPGRNADIVVEVPLDAAGLYLWCNIGDHEARRMWILWEYPDAGETDGAAASPGLAVVAAAVAVGLLLASVAGPGHRRR